MFTHKEDMCSYRAIQFALVVHGEVKAAVHPSDADKPHGETYELQDTCTDVSHGTDIRTEYIK